ncbi:Glycine-rich protein family, partial [Prunus dulcis]
KKKYHGRHQVGHILKWAFSSCHYIALDISILLGSEILIQESLLEFASFCHGINNKPTLRMADDFTPERGDVPDQTGSAEQDPAQIVAKALLCFNDKYVYSSCEESYRLNESGDLKVPAAKTDEYCNGPCLQETHLVLDCVDNILSNFLFYNKATVQDVRDTIRAGCGYGEERGKFDVPEHIKAEGSKAYKAANYQILIGLVA